MIPQYIITITIIERINFYPLRFESFLNTYVTFWRKLKLFIFTGTCLKYAWTDILASVMCWCSKRGLFFIVVRSKCWCKCWKCFIVRNEDIVSDFDLMLMRKKEEMRKRKKRRRDVDIINDNDDLIADMIVKMKEAAEVSKDSYYS